VGNTNYTSYHPEMVLLKKIELGKSEVENSNGLLHEFILNSLANWRVKEFCKILFNRFKSIALSANPAIFGEI
jgi:hypothetical protein